MQEAKELSESVRSDGGGDNDDDCRPTKDQEEEEVDDEAKDEDSKRLDDRYDNVVPHIRSMNLNPS